MKRTHKTVALASAAVAVLGLGMTPDKAFAFDSVAWDWTKTVAEDVTVDVTATIDVAPSGMLELEKTQIQIGDVTATSTVSNINNNPPVGEGGGAGGQTVSIDETFTIEAPYDDNAAGNPFVEGYTIVSSGDLEGGNLTGYVDNQGELVYLTFDVTGEIPAPQAVAGENDAIDLPLVASAATAVGNNQSIDSSSSTFLHDGQFLFGGFSAEADPELVAAITSLDPASGNSHTDILAYMAAAGVNGLITPATVSADSSVTEILNASVDSKATAVGNNMSVTLAAATEADAFMIADVTQVSYADVLATSTVDAVDLNGYVGFGAAGMGPGGLDDVAQIPLVNSAATAVGNNLSITVSGPVAVAP